MQTTMTPRCLREAVEAIDRKLNQLQPWERQLDAARKRYLLQERRDVVRLIDEGPKGGDGRPNDPDLAPFDRRFPGLRATREEIAELKERRALLTEQRPTSVETAENIQEAELRAADIRARAAELASLTDRAQATLTEAARLALALAEDTRRLWEDNVALDKFAADADIARPDTPRPEAASLPLAIPFSVLLDGYFSGGQPLAVPSDLVRDVRAALAEPEQHGQSLARREPSEG